MKFLLPLILLVMGTGGGVAAGIYFKPVSVLPVAADMPDDMQSPCGDAVSTVPASSVAALPRLPNTAGREYARINNQFVVPLVSEGAVRALVVISLSVEVASGGQDLVYAHEPRLRDVFLQVMFDHANIGGFDGTFTSAANMRNLRSALRAAARDALGDQVTDVLIVDIVRQNNS